MLPATHNVSLLSFIFFSLIALVFVPPRSHHSQLPELDSEPPRLDTQTRAPTRLSTSACTFFVRLTTHRVFLAFPLTLSAFVGTRFYIISNQKGAPHGLSRVLIFVSCARSQASASIVPLILSSFHPFFLSRTIRVNSPQQMNYISSLLSDARPDAPF